MSLCVSKSEMSTNPVTDPDQWPELNANLHSITAAFLKNHVYVGDKDELYGKCYTGATIISNEKVKNPLPL